MFNSLPDSWRGVTGTAADVKELIPEFFLQVRVQEPPPEPRPPPAPPGPVRQASQDPRATQHRVVPAPCFLMPLTNIHHLPPALEQDAANFLRNAANLPLGRRQNGATAL